MKIKPTWRELRQTLVILALVCLSLSNIAMYRMSLIFEEKLDEIYELAEFQGGMVYFEFNVEQNSGE